MAAFSSSAPARELEVHNVVKDGSLVAVLTALDDGSAVTVVAEVFAPGPDGSGRVARRRPYTFSSGVEALAFLGETVTSFTYLGCDVRKQ